MRLVTGSLLLALLFLGSLGSHSQVAQKVPLPIAAMEPYPRPVPPFVALGDSLIFVAGEDRHYSLWRSQPADGAVRRILGPEDFPFQRVLSEALGLAFFHRFEGDKAVLWRTDGTPEGTFSLGLTVPIPHPLSRPAVYEEGGQAYTIGLKGGQFQVWRTDGTRPGTLSLGLNLPDKFARTPRPVSLNGQAYFLASVPGAVQLRRTDGSTAGTELVATIPGDLQGLLYAAIGPRLFFATYEETQDFLYHSELFWVTDGSPEGTFSLENYSFFRSGFLVAGESMLFLNQSSDLEFTTHLMITDGTVAGTRRLIDHDFKPLHGPARLISFQDHYFLADRSGIWVTDGAEAGTTLAQAFPPAYFETEYACPRTLAATPQTLFARMPSEDDRCRIWATDNPLGPLERRGDFSLPEGVEFRLGFVPLGDRVFFPADDGRHGLELWTSDGTELGTRLVHDLNPLAGGSDPQDLFATDDLLAFIADDGISGSDLWTLAPTDQGPSCRPTTTSLCLQGGRFRAEAHWRDFRGSEGSGKTLARTEDTGAFWFFREENVEVMLKVLDGRERNQHFWTFYGALSNVEYWLTVTDTENGLTRRYFNPSGNFASVGDTRSFGPKGASLEFSPEPTAASSSLGAEIASYQLKPNALTACAPSSERLCLGGGRFAVEVGWTDFQGKTGHGTAGELTDDTGTFWFFRDTNIELALKVLDGRANNGHFWVFYGSLSNVDFDITVTDTETGQVKVYRNRSRQFASVGDTKAF